MVVQLRGAAATRLLGVFGESICMKEGPRSANIQSFFPETCNLLTKTQFDTSSSQAISQIPGEFQRVLRNDTIASLPGFLTAAGAKDPMVATLGPVLVQIVKRGDLTTTASDAAKQYCELNATSKFPDPKGTRACTMYLLVAAVGQTLTDCDAGTPQCADTIAVPFLNWKKEFDPQSTKTVDALIADLRQLRTLYASSQKDTGARVALFFQLLDTFGSYKKADRSAFALLRNWDRKSYRWATTALTVYQIAQDFRRGYEPIDLAKSIAARTLCITPASSDSYDAGCALKFTALSCTTMRESLAKTEGNKDLAFRLDHLREALKKMITDLPDADPLKQWATNQKLVDRVEADAVRMCEGGVGAGPSG